MVADFRAAEWAAVAEEDFRPSLWRRRLAGVFAICGSWKNRRRDAGATNYCLLESSSIRKATLRPFSFR